MNLTVIPESAVPAASRTVACRFMVRPINAVELEGVSDATLAVLTGEGFPVEVPVKAICTDCAAVAPSAVFAVTVTELANADEVSKTVALPAAFVTDVAAANDPPVVAQLTAKPAPSAAPAVSVTDAVSVVVLAPVAGIEVGLAAKLATFGARNVTVPVAGAVGLAAVDAVSVTPPAVFELTEVVAIPRSFETAL